MEEHIKPPFRADHVGSLIRPEVLINARQAAEKGELAPDALAPIQHDAIRDVVRMQEQLGLRLATEGQHGQWSDGEQKDQSERHAEPHERIARPHNHDARSFVAMACLSRWWPLLLQPNPTIGYLSTGTSGVPYCDARAVISDDD
jgi:hypothetical protein